MYFKNEKHKKSFMRAYDGNDTANKSAFTLVKVSLNVDKADR